MYLITLSMKGLTDFMNPVVSNKVRNDSYCNQLSLKRIEVRGHKLSGLTLNQGFSMKTS
jgi:hypothetical protein